MIPYPRHCVSATWLGLSIEGLWLSFAFSPLALALDAEKLPERRLVGRARLGASGVVVVLDDGLVAGLLQHVQEGLVRARNLGPGQSDDLRLLRGRLPVVVVVVDHVVAQDLGVLDESLSQVAADLLPYGLLHGQVALEVPEVTFRQSTRSASSAGRLVRVSILVGLLLVVWRVVARRGQRTVRLLPPRPRGVVVGAQVAEHVPNVGDSTIHRGLSPTHQIRPHNQEEVACFK